MAYHFEEARVLVVGDIMLDRYYIGVTKRISPEAPVPVVNVKKVKDRAGGAANVALNVATLVGSSGLCGMVGHDEAATAISELMMKASVSTFLVDTHCPTITKLRVLSQNEELTSQNDLLQQLVRLDFEKDSSDADGIRLLDRIAQVADHYNVIILSISDCCNGILKHSKEIIALAKSKGMMILVDPSKGKDFSLYEGATLLTPNRKEFEDAIGTCTSEAMLVDKAKSLIQKWKLQGLLITRDIEGMTLVLANGEVTTIPSVANNVIDVNGAGDTVIAVMAAAMSCGHELQTAMQLSNAAAGVVVGKAGTSTCNLQELHASLGVQPGRNAFEKKVGCLKELEKIIIAARQRREKIVMTNGCFDMLHAGHVDFLQKARAMGDRLIVAVNTDASVKRLKAQQRPIIDLDSRMKMLSALSCVDWVVAFEEDTPLNIITSISPHILVKGSDYKISEIVGAKEVMASGGRVEIITSDPICATSLIIDKIKLTCT